jgi:hypothetical protein
MSFAIIPQNLFYTELYEVLTENDLNMHVAENKEMIYFYTTKLLKTLITINEDVIDTENLLNAIMDYAFNKTELEKAEINTILIYSDEKYMYELIYLKNENNTDENSNQYCSVINQDMEIINGYGYIIKTNIKTLKHEKLIMNDMVNLFLKSFYHTGLLFELNNEIKEIEFITDSPFKTLGNTFKYIRCLEYFRMTFLLYSEKSEEINENASKIFPETTGRSFICVLSPISNSKFWYINKKIFLRISEILSDKKLHAELIEKISDNNKTCNPYVTIFSK